VGGTRLTGWIDKKVTGVVLFLFRLGTGHHRLNRKVGGVEIPKYPVEFWTGTDFLGFHSCQFIPCGNYRQWFPFFLDFDLPE
jgi:hypothetical protein